MYGLGCRCGTNFCQRRRRRRRVTDRKFFIAFFTFYDFLSVKNMMRAKKNFKIFGVKPILSIYSIYDERKNLSPSGCWRAEILQEHAFIVATSNYIIRFDFFFQIHFRVLLKNSEFFLKKFQKNF
jgi:hypothetical protein